jgi:hypothetical protein
MHHLTNWYMQIGREAGRIRQRRRSVSRTELAQYVWLLGYKQDGLLARRNYGVAAPLTRNEK